MKLRTFFALPILLVLILTATGLSAAAETYYVDTDGRDSNPGTSSLPFRTINKGVTALKPGDKLYVKNGTYSESLTNNIPGGTSWDNPVTLAAFPGHSVTIKPPVGSANALSFGGANQRYVIIEGFIIDGVNSRDQVIKISQDHIRIQNTEIKNLSQSGVGIWVVAGDSSGAVGCCNEFINLNVHDDRDNPANKDTVGLVIESAGNLVERSTVHSNWGDGIVLLNDDFSSANNNVIRNNRIFNNGRGGSGDGLAIGRGTGNLIYNNVVFGNPGGLSVGHQSADAKIYNNTVYGNRDFGLLIDSADGGSFNTEVKNNIFYKNGSNILDSGTFTILSNNFENDPSFTDPANGDFHLQATSAVIDLGVAITDVQDDYGGIPRPQGIAHDIGAYEFVGSPSSQSKLTAEAADLAASFNFSIGNGGRKTVPKGQSVTNSITASLKSGTPRAVSFSASDLPRGATASFSATSCNPTCSTTLTITTSASTRKGLYLIIVRGRAGKVIKRTDFNLRVTDAAPTFNFSLTNGGNKSVTRGQPVSNDVTATLSSGTSQAVSFSMSGVPTGSTASYANSTPCNPTCSRTINITTSTSTPTGPHTITVTGTGGGVTKTTSFTLTVNALAPVFDFSLTNGGNKSVTQGQSVGNSITATLSSGTAQAVSFSTSGLPTGASASYSTSNSCNPTCSRTLNITTSASTPMGPHTITVTGTGGGVTRTTNFTLSVNAATVATLQVGPTRQYKTIAAAVNAAQNGSTIEIDAGIYPTESITISKHDLTLRGIGGYAHLMWGTGNYLTNTAVISNGKGILVISGNNITIENLEFSGAKVVDENGAGIRYEGGNLTIRRSYFHDNENGILGQGGSNNTLLIENSIFESNGYCPSSCAHNVYIGHMGKLIFRYNKSIDSHEGHALKSRAQINEIISNYFSTKNSDGSYEAEFPNGGTVYFIGNIVEQGVNTGNSTMLGYGFEGATNPNPAIYVINNTFYNLRGSGTFLSASGTPTVTVKNNVFGGGGTIGVSADTSNKTSAASSFVSVTSSDYRLVAGSPAVDAGVNPGTAGTYNLAPQSEYVEPAGSQLRVVNGTAIDVGAYELGSSSPSAPAPTVSLSANPSSVVSGSASTLTWSSTNASSCTASGGWSGTKAVSGSQGTGTLTVNATFTLTCTGAGGSASQSATVTVTPFSSFDFSLSNGGNKSVTQGQSVGNSITATLSSGLSQAVSFSTSPLPSGVTVSYTTSNSCNPTCSRTLNITTSASTPTGPHTITVTGTGGGATKTTSFTLTVNAPATAGSIILAWTDNSGDENGFNIERKTGTNGTFAQIANVGINVNSYTDSGLTAGTIYCYRVNAFNSVGGSAYTNESCKAAGTPAPAFDFSLTNGGNKSVAQGQSVGNDITATISSGTSQAVSFSASGLPTGASTSYSTSNSCNPTCSRTLNITTSASTPTGPHTITVSGTGGGITKTTTFTLTVNVAPNGGVLDVVWTDNSSNEDGFNIERRTGTNGTFAQIASAAANSNSYTDSGLMVGTTYCYRLSAFNTGGVSSYSNELCGTAR